MSGLAGHGFAADLTAALNSDVLHGADLDDQDLEYEDELLEEGLATKPVVPSISRLMSVPAATQEDVQDDDDYAGHDDRELELLGSQYSTLTSKTQRINKLMYEKGAMMDGFDVIGTPFEILQVKHDEIAAMCDGSDKMANIKMFNTINVLFAECRRNEELREFMSRLFKQTYDYYSLKSKRSAMDCELQMLIKLRDEQELDNFREKQKKRVQSELAEAGGKVKKVRH